MRTVSFLAAALLVCACQTETQTAPAPTSTKTTSPKVVPAAASAPAPAAASAPADNTPVASGTLTLPAGAKASGKFVFVSLRAPAGGPPLAAKRLPPGPFPMKFTVTEADKISMGGAARPIPAEFKLKAKLDVDGNAMSTTAGDHQVVKMVKKGTTGLSLELAPTSP